MKTNGFTLVELMITMAVMGVLITLSALYFNTMSRKSQLERQTKEMYADLMGSRTQALYQKQARTVTVSAGQYTITPWDPSGGTATVLQRKLLFPVTVNPAGVITFEARGGMVDSTVCICAEPSGSPSAVDSILVFPTSIAIGKRNTGGACTSAQIAVQ